MNQSYYITAERMRLEKQQSEERGMACSHEPPLFPLPCHILAFFSSGSYEISQSWLMSDFKMDLVL